MRRVEYRPISDSCTVDFFFGEVTVLSRIAEAAAWDTYNPGGKYPYGYGYMTPYLFEGRKEEMIHLIRNLTHVLSVDSTSTFPMTSACRHGWQVIGVSQEYRTVRVSMSSEDCVDLYIFVEMVQPDESYFGFGKQIYRLFWQHFFGAGCTYGYLYAGKHWEDPEHWLFTHSYRALLYSCQKTFAP